MRRHAPSRRGLALGAVALLLLGAGCSRSPHSPKVASAGGSTASAAATVDPELAGLSEKEKALKFAQCMRDNGVPMDDPTFTDGGGIGINVGGGKGGDTLEKSKVDAAMQKCKKFSPMEGGTGKIDPKAQENMLKMSQCMRDNGVEKFPDPSNNGIAIDRSIAEDPQFEAAQAKCEKLYGPPGGGRKTTVDGPNS